MASRPESIARIRLARSLRRLVALPIALFAAGAAAITAGLLAVAGPPGVALVVLGATVMVGGLVAATTLFSLRVEVEESSVAVHWLGGRRAYPLVAGPVTRVRLRGPTASTLRPRTGALGWGIGPALLRGSERIEVVRLAPTATVILVPTERGRLALAPVSDDELLAALSRAARARQRLAVLAPPEPEPAAAAPEAPPPEPEPAPPPPLTGIERARLAEAADRAAPVETAAVTVPQAEPQPEAELEAEPAVEPERAEPEPPGPAAEPAPLPRRGRRIGVRPRPAIALVFLPLVGAGAAWGIGLATGRMPEPGTDLARLTTLALVMAGPASSVGAIMALAWWPRLVGVVVTGGLAAAVLIGRALIGP